MKVLMTVPEGGKIILDPVRLPQIMRNSKGGRKGFANGVLTREHLVVSTVACSSHHDCAGRAGIDLVDIDWLAPVPGEGHVRLQFDENTVEAEFWYGEDVYEKAECPLSSDQLATMAEWIAAHPAIVRAYGGTAPVVEISLLHDGIRMWKYHGNAIRETQETPRPTGMAP